MTYYDDIYEIAVDNYYLITTEQAAEAGVPGVELAKLAHRGKLENVSRGLYRLARWVPEKNYPYAEAVMRMGAGAYLYGESVVAMLELAPTDPSRMFVAVPGRTRRKLPDGVRVMKASPGDRVVSYEGVPSQHVACAIAAARRSMMEDRLQAAAERAREQGYLIAGEYEALKKEMRWQ